MWPGHLAKIAPTPAVSTDQPRGAPVSRGGRGSWRGRDAGEGGLGAGVGGVGRREGGWWGKDAWLMGGVAERTVSFQRGGEKSGAPRGLVR